jgi:hypothetical protein
MYWSGEHLFVGDHGINGAIHMFQVFPELKEMEVLRGHKKGVQYMTGAETTLISCGDDGGLIVWDISQ